jgi:hypothetical protein
VALGKTITPAELAGVARVMRYFSTTTQLMEDRLDIRDLPLPADPNVISFAAALAARRGQQPPGGDDAMITCQPDRLLGHRRPLRPAGTADLFPRT